MQHRRISGQSVLALLSVRLRGRGGCDRQRMMMMMKTMMIGHWGSRLIAFPKTRHRAPCGSAMRKS